MGIMSLKSDFVVILMGSESDREVMQPAADILKEFGIPYEWKVISAHRTPDLLHDYVKDTESRGAFAYIGGAGGAAHLPGVIAAFTTRPVLGVPVHTTKLLGLDSLLSIVNMPKGVPVATFSVGPAGAANAAIYAASMLGVKNDAIYEKVKAYRLSQKEKLEAGSQSSMEVFQGNI